MATGAQPPTAKIYRFPVRIGATVTARDPAARSEAPRVPPRPRTDFGSAWYHDAAIDDPDGRRSH